jgi:hypothetical protein
VSTSFSAPERRLIARLRTPRDVQAYLNRLPYNQEPHGRATLRGFRGVVSHGCAHCLEAALFAAVVLEQHGYPPLVISFESVDALDHVVFAYRERGRWGSIARSRDPGLHGRRAVFATPRALAASYMDPYVDYTGRITGYALVNLADAMGSYNWRWREGNVWKVERVLLDWPHRPLTMSDARYQALKARYLAFKDASGGKKPVYYDSRDTWTPIPRDRNWARSSTGHR